MNGSKIAVAGAIIACVALTLPTPNAAQTSPSTRPATRPAPPGQPGRPGMPVQPGQAGAFSARDLLDIVAVSGRIAIAPQAGRVAYVLPDKSDEWNVLARRPVGYVHVQEVGAATTTPSDSAGGLLGSATPLTSGAERSSFPAWSPAGDKLAFYIEDGAGGRLAVWDSATRQTRRIGPRFAGKASSGPVWATDLRIVYATPSAPAPEPEKARVEVVRSSDKLIPGDAFFARTGEAGLAVADLVTGDARALLGPRVLRQFAVSPGGRYLTFLVPSEETLGIVGGEVNETFLMALDGGRPTRIDATGRRYAWSPEGDKLVTRRRDGWYALPVVVGAMMRSRAAGGIPGGATGGGPVQGGGAVTTMVAVGDAEPYFANLSIPLGGFGWSPDATRFTSLVADRSITDPEVEPGQPGMYSIARPFADLYLVSAADGAAVNLTASFDDNVADPLWSPDGRSIVFRAVDNRTYDETIYRYRIADAELWVLAAGEESYGNLVAGNDRVFLTIQSATTAPDLWMIADGGERYRLTDLNPQLRGFTFSEPELFHFDSTPGDRLGALLYRPTTVAAGGAGVITYIYEKLTPGIHRFNARQQMFVSHGYAVLMPNVKIRVGETGTSYVDSVVPAVEAVRAMGFTNGKFCLWGGSFGAYGTSFVITQTTVFDCAVSRATPPELFRNWASGRDRDSNNIERGQARMGGSPFEFQERYIAQSAFFHLDKVETPVLIMHGVKDYTILFGEGEMMFYALRRLGKDAEFVIYNEGDHSLSRHSRDDTLDVNRRMLAWFEKYLK